MKKIVKIFAYKRVQGAFIIVLVWLLQQFGIIMPETVQNSLAILIQALGALWGIYGAVDAFPGDKRKNPA